MKISNAYTKLMTETFLQEIRDLFLEVTDDAPCDCCKYFDYDSLRYFSGLEKPLYFMVAKRSQEQLKYINPKQYIYAIARGFGVSYDDTIAHVRWEDVDKYAEMMKSGSKAPIGYYREGESGQEGRHRALAAMKLGCEQIPIVVIREIGRNELERFALEHKDKSFEEMDELFISMGYKDGISGLGYGDFERFVRYNLSDN